MSTSQAAHRLVLASHNAGKLRELQALFDPEAQVVSLLSAQGLGLHEPEEPFHTFLENALHKARQASAASGLPALADDSGLAVAALGGAPGVWSATYAPAVPDVPDVLGQSREARRARQDQANITLLLQRLEAATVGSAWPDRRARFVCTLVAVRSATDPEPLVAQGRWEGEILTQPQGQGGFGYDPILWIESARATVATLDPHEKNRQSHRALAAALMRQQMRQVWGWPIP